MICTKSLSKLLLWKIAPTNQSWSIDFHITVDQILVIVLHSSVNQVRTNLKSANFRHPLVVGKSSQSGKYHTSN